MTTDGRDLTPKETMGALRRMAEDDARREEQEIARAEAMTAEERRAFLRSRGVDVARVRARTAELRARLAPALGQGAGAATASDPATGAADVEAQPFAIPKEPDPAARVPARGPALRRRPELTWVIAAAAATAVAGGAIAAARYLHHDDPPKPEPPEEKHEPAPPQPKPEDPLVAAASLRQKAALACEAKDWSACRSLLDAARDKDPEGDVAAEWQGLRAQATAGLLRDEKKKNGP